MPFVPVHLRWTAGTLAAAIAGAITVAILAGAWAARVVAPGSDARPPESRTVRAGPARLEVPSTWRPAAPAGIGLARLDGASTEVLTPSPGLPVRAVVAHGPADDASLIPHSLRTVLREPLPRARATSLGGRPAWSYRALDTHRRPRQMVVTVLPTTAGVIAVGCTWPVYLSSSVDCASAVKSVSLADAAALMPSPSVALAARLPAVLARLDRARVDGRDALERARTNEAQALAARHLADRFLTTADALAPVAGTASSAVVESLASSGRAYAALGGAAAAGSPARFSAARRDVRAAEAGLGHAVDRVLRDGTRPSGLTATASRGGAQAGTSSPASEAQLVLVILALLASLAAGFMSSGPLSTAARRLARQ